MSCREISRHRQLNVWRMEITRQNNIFKMGPTSRKLQEPGKKQNKINEINRTVKLCTLATNNLILS